MMSPMSDLLPAVARTAAHLLETLRPANTPTDDRARGALQDVIDLSVQAER
jgi:hypothetical protein